MRDFGSLIHSWVVISDSLGWLCDDPPMPHHRLRGLSRHDEMRAACCGVLYHAETWFCGFEWLTAPFGYQFPISGSKGLSSQDWLTTTAWGWCCSMYRSLKLTDGNYLEYCQVLHYDWSEVSGSTDWFAWLVSWSLVFNFPFASAAVTREK